MKAVETVEQLQKRVVEFAKDRDWGQFHTPKNLAMALCSEAGEAPAALLRWVDGEASRETAITGPERWGKIADELGDVGILLLQFCNQCNLDFAQIVRYKLDKVGASYPIAKAKGKAECS